MPERSSKRKARRDSPVNSLDEPESSSMRSENAASLSDKDFTELSEKIEKSVSKRIKDAEVGQREILKMIENLTSKIDTLTERPSNNVRHGPDDEDAENTEYRYRLVGPSDLLPNHGQHSRLGELQKENDATYSEPPTVYGETELVVFEEISFQKSYPFGPKRQKSSSGWFLCVMITSRVEFGKSRQILQILKLTETPVLNFLWL